MTARGEDLAELCAARRGSATRVWNRRTPRPGGRLPITYSRKVFIPVTHLCRDNCHYCTFVTVPGKLRAQGAGMYLEPDEILDIARRGAELGCKEALFTLGDRPEDRWPRGRRVARRTGLRLHAVLRSGDGDPGAGGNRAVAAPEPRRDELVGDVAAQAGGAVHGHDAGDDVAAAVRDEGLAHYGSPDKDPAVRLRTLTDAGRLSIPFTTGLLVGIGETLVERADTLHAISQVAQRVRTCPRSDRAELPGQGAHRDGGVPTPDRRLPGDGGGGAVGAGSGYADPGAAQPGSREECLALLAAGVDDWGGVSPLTPDHVNPERPWPALTSWPPSPRRPVTTWCSG